MEIRGYTDCLSYKEVYDLKNNVQETKNAIINRTNCTLCKQLLDNMPTELTWEKCWRVKVDLLDGMNVVSKIEEIQIVHEQLRVPCVENIPMPMYRKLTFKERLKVLFKGGI